MNVIDIAQRSPEWHAWRKKGVSATSLAIILGKNPDKSRRQLWLELMGLVTPPDLSVIPQVRKGAKLEPVALQAFEAKYGQLSLPICAEHDKHSIIRASFDGLMDGKKPVEIKNLAEQNHLEVLEKTDESSFYQLYQWQVKHQLVVSGASQGFLWFWSPKHEPVLLEVRLDQEERDFIIKACLDFWQMVEDEVIPDPDLRIDPMPFEEMDVEDQRQWTEISTVRRNLEIQIREHKEALAALTIKAKEEESKLRALMGDYKIAESDGVRIAEYEIRGKVNWEALAHQLDPLLKDSDIDSFRGNSTSGVRVTVNTSYDPAQAPARPIPFRRAKPKPSPKTDTGARNVSFWF